MSFPRSASVSTDMDLMESCWNPMTRSSTFSLADTFLVPRVDEEPAKNQETEALTSSLYENLISSPLSSHLLPPHAHGFDFDSALTDEDELFPSATLSSSPHGQTNQTRSLYYDRSTDEETELPPRSQGSRLLSLRLFEPEEVQTAPLSAGDGSEDYLPPRGLPRRTSKPPQLEIPGSLPVKASRSSRAVKTTGAPKRGRGRPRKARGSANSAENLPNFVINQHIDPRMARVVALASRMIEQEQEDYDEPIPEFLLEEAVPRPAPTAVSEPDSQATSHRLREIMEDLGHSQDIDSAKDDANSVWKELTGHSVLDGNSRSIMPQSAVPGLEGEQFNPFTVLGLTKEYSPPNIGPSYQAAFIPALLTASERRQAELRNRTLEPTLVFQPPLEGELVYDLRKSRKATNKATFSQMRLRRVR